MGFYVELPEHRKKPIPEFVGPVIRLGVCTTTTWNACVFVACKHNQLQFTWSIEGQQSGGQVQPESAGTAAGWYFFRFPLSDVQLQPQPQTIVYEIRNGAKVVSARIPVAGSQQEWNLMAYSCYDQRRAVGEALWHDASGAPQTPVMPAHQSNWCSGRMPGSSAHQAIKNCCFAPHDYHAYAAKGRNPETAYHAILGGGDQVRLHFFQLTAWPDEAAIPVSHHGGCRSGTRD